ncbi:hypothetical protein PRZ48_003697 [Zasmidium cellare]|uniref:Uncharacterized protein n=1 Tax=Zasmidium cellare TaxID=395010 RepID=A0ABR0EW50_ZASCE|nr:hypothetical protein PRZ48_003697 [Zasmidium cellare]
MVIYYEADKTWTDHLIDLAVPIILLCWADFRAHLIQNTLIMLGAPYLLHTTGSITRFLLRKMSFHRSGMHRVWLQWRYIDRGRYFACPEGLEATVLCNLGKVVILIRIAAGCVAAPAFRGCLAAAIFGWVAVQAIVVLGDWFFGVL